MLTFNDPISHIFHEIFFEAIKNKPMVLLLHSLFPLYVLCNAPWNISINKFTDSKVETLF